MGTGHGNQERRGSDSQLELCMYCGATILRGAMRCVSCGKILKTPEEQSAAIRDIMKRQHRVTVIKVFRLAAFLAGSCAAYLYYSDHIHEFVSKLFSK